MNLVEKFRLFIAICIFASMSSFSGCGPHCPNTSEPLMNVEFTNINSPVVYQTATSKEIKTVFNGSDKRFYLPLSLNQDRLTYFFSNGTKTDTLTISYTRDFGFHSQQCGFVLNIEDLKAVPPTSFKKVEIDNFGGYYDYFYDIQIRIDD